MEATTIPVLFLLFLSFLLLAAVKSRRRTTVLPPGPPGWPIIGNLLQIGDSPHRSFAKLSKIYGAVMSLKLGSLRTVIISSPEAAREVLKTHDHVLSGRTASDPVRAIDHQHVSIGWLSTTSPLWRLLRKISATQLFSPQRLDATKSIRRTKVKELVSFINESCKRGEAVNIGHISFVTSINIISNILFSTDLVSYDPKASQEIQNTVVRIMQLIGKPNLADYFPVMKFFDLQGVRKEMKMCTKRLFQVFQGFIDARNIEKSSQIERKNESDSDFLDYLMQESESQVVNVNDIKHFLLDMFIAGTDTNSTTVEWAMTELLRNPDIMTKAQTELNQAVNNENGVVEESVVMNLPYLQAIIKETLRLHPTGPLLIPRKAESDANVLGYLIPKNAQVLVNVWAIGRDSSVWENAERFEPERFLERENDVKGRDFKLIPFGFGRRICPGMGLATKILSLVIGSLLFSFQWKLENGVVSEDLIMDETFGLSLHKTSPLYAVPVKKR